MNEKSYKAIQSYFYEIEKFDNLEEINDIIYKVMQNLGFNFYSFQIFEDIKNFLGYLPNNLITPGFFVSKNKQDLFLVGFINSNYQNNLVVFFNLYSNNGDYDYSNELNLVISEFFKHKGINYKHFTSSNVVGFNFNSLKKNFLNIAKEYTIDKEKLELDKYFLDHKVISISYDILSKNYSNLSLEDLKYLDLLEKNNFLKIFVTFKCSSSGSSIFQLNKLDNIGILLDNFRCPICNKRLSEENREISITVSPFFEIYFNNLIWLKNVVFNYLINKMDVKIFEYDKNVFLVKYLNILVLFIFIDYSNFIHYLSYYKDAEILDLNHIFFFVLNYKNYEINYSLIEKFDNKIAVVNINKDILLNIGFSSILSDIENKIKNLYNLFQLKNVNISIGYETLIERKDIHFDKLEQNLESNISLIEQKLEENLVENIKENIIEYVEENLQNNEISHKHDLEKKEEKTEYSSEEEIFDLLNSIIENTENKDEQQLNREAITQEIITQETVNQKTVNQETDSVLELSDIKEFNKEDRDIENVIRDIDDFIEGASKTEVSSNEILLEVNNLVNQIAPNQQVEVLEKQSLIEEKPETIDDLIKQVKVNFYPELDKDINMKELISIFYHLLAGMSKEKLAFIEKNIQFFNQSLKIKYPFLNYYVIFFSTKAVSLFPKNDSLLPKFQSIFNYIYQERDWLINDKEIYNFYIYRNEMYFNFIYNITPNLIISVYNISLDLPNNVVDSYPLELKNLKVEIINRVVNNLENLKISNAISNFVVLNSDFAIINGDSISSDVLLNAYKYTKIFSNIDLFIIGFGNKERLNILFKFDNVMVLIQKDNLTLNLTLNDLFNLYNSMYLLEII